MTFRSDKAPRVAARASAPAARRPRSIRSFGAVALAALALFVAGAVPALAQSRTLEMKFSHTGETLKVVYKRNGQYVPSAMREINHFLRDWRRNESTTMNPELIDLLWETQQNFGGKTIFVVSAYRSPATNAMLRSRSRGVAKTSQHMLGHATDFYIPGVSVAELRAFGVSRQVGGVGFYPSSGSPFVHFDVGSVRAWPRMSRAQLVKIFPDGKTLHLPTDGKPLSGYAEAQALEKAGRLAKLNRGGGGGGSSGGGLIAGLFSGGGGGGGSRGDDRDRDRVQVAAVQRDVIVPTERRTAAPARSPDPQDTPVRVQTASVAPTTTDNDDEGDGRGIFRQLPSVSLGGLIDRFRDEDEGDEDAARPEVVPVAPPAAPLTAVAAQDASDADEAPAAGAAPAGATTVAVPLPVRAPRPAAAPGAEPPAAAPSEPVLLAALPPSRPAQSGPEPEASDVMSALAYGPAAETDDASPLNATVAIVPRPPALPSAPVETAAVAVEDAGVEAVVPPVLPTAFSPVRGASQRLIADASGVGGDGFSTLTAPDRNGAASGGVLLAQGFLGAPSTFSRTPPTLNTDRFTGLTITVFARPRS